MKGDVRDTLILPFEKGTLEFPAFGNRGIFLNAQSLRSSEDWQSVLDCEQSVRGNFLELQQHHFDAAPEVFAGDRDFGLVLAGKHKRLNKQNIRRVISMVNPGGLIVVAGEKTAGISSLRKYVGQSATIQGFLSKYHGTVFWFKNPGAEDLPEIPPHVPPEDYFTLPGMFSADHVDPGSEVLASYFDKKIAGNVADYGAGWGYLSHQLLKHGGNIAHLDLYEADWHALEAAKKNVMSDEVRLGYYWHDLAREKVDRSYDWVIMNPPFHSGQKAEPHLGQKILEVASQSLRKGGRLLLVANRNLPYEKTIEQHFSSQSKLFETSAYKVIEAVR